jgi:hypothetical protein
MSQTIEISTEVLSQEVYGEMVLLDLKSEEYIGLNEVGARIWQLLQDGKDLKEISDILIDEYDVSKEELDGDINRLVVELQDAGLVVVK